MLTKNTEKFKSELITLEEEHLDHVKKNYSLNPREYERHRLLTGQFLSRILKGGIENKWDKEQIDTALNKAKNALNKAAEIYSNSIIDKTNAEIKTLLKNNLSLN